ncbi:hydrolase 1, exosortase A system-associated [Sphingorhabdus lutea]|uniref:Hydrolase 1, exosortase A system-associated n=2 Tax=Sphingorhabdus lutea TaxID=1913578 RepID=A0A1L3JBF4_9SPHN|nr:hydrolase 1, exosortase A system-associated [Sphingorhabdus lutea]
MTVERTFFYRDCMGDQIAMTMDKPTIPANKIGIVIVSGGNEIRTGAHRGQAKLSRELAKKGFTILRYDRRGVGDSTGKNKGFMHARDDIFCALTAICDDEIGMEKIFIIGNCDAATSIAINAHAASEQFPKLSGHILTNPWTIDIAEPNQINAAAPHNAVKDDLPSAAAIRARYLKKITDPAAWKQLLSGGTNIGKIFAGLKKSFQKNNLSVTGKIYFDALSSLNQPTKILLAQHDNTAISFYEIWKGKYGHAARANPHIHLAKLDSASHSFADEQSFDWLITQITDYIIEI